MTTYGHKQYKRKRHYPRPSIREQALAAQCKELEAQLNSALVLLHEKGDRITELKTAVDLANAEFRQQYKACKTAVDQLVAADRRIVELEEHNRALQTEVDDLSELADAYLVAAVERLAGVRQ
jgi:chromosome segregation ATPase